MVPAALAFAVCSSRAVGLTTHSIRTRFAGRLNSGVRPLMADLNIAEIPYESGVVRFRYSRCLSADGSRWVRHGLFCAYHEDGSLASEGIYEQGQEHGFWRDYHPNGQLAADGQYTHGTETGIWRYWSEAGVPELLDGA
ncbi:toxin-antitoxin system YwqK family antitoxin [Xanthomonas arboricola]|uniref:toxin-antitoxin system YwqK family antitoxin n=2 Tax=Xanthomonas arboricola TaxID=56448 RepID=UPI00387E7712